MDWRCIGVATAVCATVTVLGGRAARADVTYVGGQTVITSGQSGTAGLSGVATPGVFDAGADSGMTFTYGYYDEVTKTWSAHPDTTISGWVDGEWKTFATSGTAKNVEALDSYNQPWVYSGPLPGSSWVSAYVETDSSSAYYKEPERVGNMLSGDFAYTIDFELNPAQAWGNFSIEGVMYSDDRVKSIWLDWGTSYAQEISFVNGPDFSYQYLSSFGSTGSHPDYPYPGTKHSLTFFVQNNFNDRTGFNFSATAVPEPGAVAFGVVMGGGLLGLVVRARQRRRQGGEAEALAVSA
jgi:hypothetical protein